MAVENLNALTASDFDDGIPEVWEQKVIYDASRISSLKKFEGPEGTNSVIIRKDDPLKKAGDRINFITIGNLYGDGVSGSSTLAGQEEKFDVDGFYLEPDLVRHAVAFRGRAEGRALFKPAMVAGKLLSNWYARKTDDDALNQLISTDSPTTLYAGGAGAENQLNDTTAFGVDELERLQIELETMGAIPYEIERSNGEIFPVYGCWISEFDAWKLKGDAAWKDLHAEAGVRGESNPLFRGSIGMIGSMMVYVYRAGGRGFQGTPLRPETRINGAHTNSVTTLTVGIGSDTKPNWTKNFPSSGTLSVINSSGAREFITYTGKTNRTFTGCTRGASYGSPSISSTASTYTGGEFISLNNHSATVVGFGAHALARSFVSAKSTIRQIEDYGEQTGIGLKATYGQKAIKNTVDENANYVIMKTNTKPQNAV